MPTAPATSLSAGAPDPRPLSSQAVARYRLTLDPEALTGTFDPVLRLGAGQGALTTLPFDADPSRQLVQLLGISTNAEAVYVRYTTTHPVPAPTDLRGTSSGTNRADLGVTGRILWLADHPDPLPYFRHADEVRLNSRLVRNPNGYFAPGAQVDLSGMTATAFPFQLLVDEREDPRLGVSNEGVVTGNYGASAWQINDFVAGLTGFGILAQGQTSVHTLALNRAELAAHGPFTIDLVFLLKHTDPRGGATSAEQRANRLPVNDIARFAYRMPHGALDLESITLATIETTLRRDIEGSCTLHAHVVDWDTWATPSAFAQLAKDPDPSHVFSGETGRPRLEVDLPALLESGRGLLTVEDNDVAYGGDLARDLGRPCDALYYTGTLSGTPLVEGPVTGLLRATDPVDFAPPLGWSSQFTALDADLQPLSTTREGKVYQVFTVTIAPGGTAPVASWRFNSAQQIVDLRVVEIILTTTMLSQSNTSGRYAVEVDWGEGPVQEFTAQFADGEQTYRHLYRYTGAGDEPQQRTLSVQVTDADPPQLSATAKPPLNPVVTISPAMLTTGWATQLDNDQSLIPNSLAVSSDGIIALAGQYRGNFTFPHHPGPAPTGNGLFVAEFAPDGGLLWLTTAGLDASASNLQVEFAANGDLVGWGWFRYTWTGGPWTFSTRGNTDALLVRFDSVGDIIEAQSWGTTGSEYGSAIAIGPDQSLVLLGHGEPGFSLGGPPLTATGSFCATLSPNLEFREQYLFQELALPNALALTDSGKVLLGGGYAGTVDVPADFGGGPHVAHGDPFAIRLSPDLEFEWEYLPVGDVGGSYIEVIAESPLDHSLWCAGGFRGTVDFSGSVRTAYEPQDLFLVHLTEAGMQLAVGCYGRPDYEYIREIVVDRQGRPTIAAKSLSQGTEFGGGPFGTNDVGLIQFTPDLAWRWQLGYIANQMPLLALSPNEHLIFSGMLLVDQLDFDPGPAEHLLFRHEKTAYLTQLTTDGTW